MQASNQLILAVLQVVPFVAQLNISSSQLFVCRFNLLTIYVLGNTRLPQAPIESYTCRRLAPTTGSGHQGPVPGLFLYTPNMPSVILTNICTRLGLFNGATGTAVGIVVDPAGDSSSFAHRRQIKYLTISAEFYEIDDLYILCTKPAACVLFKQNKSSAAAFGRSCACYRSCLSLREVNHCEVLLCSQETNPHVPGILSHRL